MSFSDSIPSFQDFLQSVEENSSPDFEDKIITPEEHIFLESYSKKINDSYGEVEDDIIKLISRLKYNKIKQGVVYPSFIENIISQIDNSA